MLVKDMPGTPGHQRLRLHQKAFDGKPYRNHLSNKFYSICTFICWQKLPNYLQGHCNLVKTSRYYTYISRNMLCVRVDRELIENHDTLTISNESTWKL